MMATRLQAMTFLVDDYDRAIAFFTTALGFELLEDTALSDDKRWVRVGQPDGGTCLLLAKADSEDQRKAIGNAAGGRVAFFMHTNNFAKDHAHMISAGVKFREEPRHEAYGTVAVFEDIYGNGWDLIEPKAP
jgi:catechol 2,3-dioxygenase-like lactoylglutathione lyase family enzyme